MKIIIILQEYTGMVLCRLGFHKWINQDDKFLGVFFAEDCSRCKIVHLRKLKPIKQPPAQ